MILLHLYFYKGYTMKSSSSKPIKNNNEKVFLPGDDFTFFAIVIITIALLIIPWIIDQYTPAMSAVLGYTGKNFCLNPYAYNILIVIGVVLSVISLLLSRLLVKSPSYWKVFMLFEAALLLSILIIAFLQSSLCDGRSWSFL